MFAETISPAEAAKRLSDPLVHFAGHDDDAASEPSTSQSSNGGTPSEAREAAREAARALFDVPFVGRLLRRLFRKREEEGRGRRLSVERFYINRSDERTW